jgi:phosphate transport system substrate-binding protein
VTISTRNRLAGVALAAAFVVGACSSSGATASPSTAASSEPSMAPSMAAGESSAPSAMAVPTPPSGDISLQGAGATFPAPLYATWFEKFSEKYANVKIDYQSNGSGAGIKAITQQTVDFGASDAPMKDAEIAALPAGTKVVHFPTALGAVVLIYNLPGVSELKLDSQNVADLFLGTIKKWDDAKIAANNPGVTLPSTDVLIVHRADSSGTTNAFTTYLDTVSPGWHTAVGKGKDVKWPTGIGGQGNDGVAGGVKQTAGALGYVELNYATKAGLTSAKLKNADGNFVAGSTDGVTAAADAIAAGFPADSRQDPIINGKGPNTYPIASYTYLLVYQDQADKTKGAGLVAFIAWALTDGQALEKDLGYAPLPASVDAKALADLHTITSGGSPIWP